MDRKPSEKKRRRKRLRTRPPCEAYDYRAFKLAGVRYVYLDPCPYRAYYEQEVLNAEGRLETAKVCRRHTVTGGAGNPELLPRKREPRGNP